MNVYWGSQEFSRHCRDFRSIIEREPPERRRGRQPGGRPLVLQQFAEQLNAQRFAVRFDLRQCFGRGYANIGILRQRETIT